MDCQWFSTIVSTVHSSGAGGSEGSLAVQSYSTCLWWSQTEKMREVPLACYSPTGTSTTTHQVLRFWRNWASLGPARQKPKGGGRVGQRRLLKGRDRGRGRGPGPGRQPESMEASGPRGTIRPPTMRWSWRSTGAGTIMKEFLSPCSGQ